MKSMDLGIGGQCLRHSQILTSDRQPYDVSKEQTSSLPVSLPLTLFLYIQFCLFSNPKEKEDDMVILPLL